MRKHDQSIQVIRRESTMKQLLFFTGLLASLTFGLSFQPAEAQMNKDLVDAAPDEEPAVMLTWIPMILSTRFFP